MARHAGTARRGWKGNALGLQKWEVECAHQARLDATEAVADLMRRGKSFAEAKAIIEARAASVYKHSRPELYEGYRRCVGDVQFADMPKDIMRKISDDFLASIEKARGKPVGPINRWLWNTFGFIW